MIAKKKKNQIQIIVIATPTSTTVSPQTLTKATMKKRQKKSKKCNSLKRRYFFLSGYNHYSFTPQITPNDREKKMTPQESNTEKKKH